MIAPPAETVGLRSATLVDGELHLVLNGALAAIDEGRLRLLAHFEPHGLSARTINRLEVVFEELVANVVMHGFTDHPGGSLHVWAAMRENGVELLFEDDGRPFDPLSAPEPEPFTTLEEARVGGLGIPLVLRLSSSVLYEHAPARDGWTAARVNRTRVALATV